MKIRPIFTVGPRSINQVTVDDHRWGRKLGKAEAAKKEAKKAKELEAEAMIQEAKEGYDKEAKMATEPEAEDWDEGTYERIPTISFQ